MGTFRITQNFLIPRGQLFDILEIFRLSGSIPDRLESYQTTTKAFRQSGKLTDNPENVRIIWKFSKHLRMCPDRKERLKNYRNCAMFPDRPKSFQNIWKAYKQSENRL